MSVVAIKYAWVGCDEHGNTEYSTPTIEGVYEDSDIAYNHFKENDCSVVMMVGNMDQKDWLGLYKMNNGFDRFKVLPVGSAITNDPYGIK